MTLFEIWFEPIVGALERSASGWQKRKEKKSGRLWIPDTFLIANLACLKRIDKTKKKREGLPTLKSRTKARFTSCSFVLCRIFKHSPVLSPICGYLKKIKSLFYPFSKGKFFSEDIMLLVRSPIFANILLSFSTEKCSGAVKCLQILAIWQAT